MDRSTPKFASTSDEAHGNFYPTAHSALVYLIVVSVVLTDIVGNKSAAKRPKWRECPSQESLNHHPTAPFVKAAYTRDELRAGPAPEWGIKLSIFLLVPSS